MVPLTVVMDEILADRPPRTGDRVGTRDLKLFRTQPLDQRRGDITLIFNQQ